MPFEAPKRRDARTAVVTMRISLEERDIIDAIAALEGLDGVSGAIRFALAHFTATHPSGRSAVEEVRRADMDRARRVAGKRQRRLNPEP